MTEREITIAMNTISGTPTIITPAIAKVMLETNDMNRIMSRDTVAGYAEEMLEGHWACNGEAIIFADSGKLLDGQHRLQAVVETGCTIVSIVSRGVPEKDFDSMGQGRKRTNGTILGIENVKNSDLYASTVRGLFIYAKEGIMKRTTSAFSARKMKDARMKMTLLESSVDYASTFKRPLFTKSIIAMLHNTFCNIDYEQGLDFMDAVLTGDVKGELELLKVRNHFLDLKLQGFDLGHKREFVCGVLIKAWNAWRDEEILKDFEYNRGEEFPKAR